MTVEKFRSLVSLVESDRPELVAQLRKAPGNVQHAAYMRAYEDFCAARTIAAKDWRDASPTASDRGVSLAEVNSIDDAARAKYHAAVKAALDEYLAVCAASLMLP